MEESKAVLDAIKESDNRTERMLLTLTQALQDQQETLIKGFATLETALSRTSGSDARGVSLGHLLTIIGAMVAVGSFLFVNVTDDVSDVERRLESFSERERTNTAVAGQTSARLAMTDERSKQAQSDNDRILQWQEQHDLRVRATNATQDERLCALERSEYGKATQE